MGKVSVTVVSLSQLIEKLLDVDTDVVVAKANMASSWKQQPQG